MVMSVAVVPGVAVCGEKVTVAPDGNPVALSVMGKLKGPRSGVTVALKMAALPGMTVWSVEIGGFSGCGSTSTGKRMRINGDCVR